LKVNIKRISPLAVVPKYGTEDAGCFDLFAAISEPVTLYPGNMTIIDTGIQFEVPKGHVMLIHSRSGHGFKHRVRLANSTGVLDADYRGVCKVALTHDAESETGHPKPLVINPGDRIAQAMIIKYDKVEFAEVEDLSETVRGEGGFGSTGA